MIKQIAELALPELTLAMARHEKPNADAKIYGFERVEYLVSPGESLVRKIFRLDWADIGPLWEREAENYVRHETKKRKSLATYSGHAERIGLISAFQASKSPESIARALLTMWYPQGIELEAV